MHETAFHFYHFDIFKLYTVVELNWSGREDVFANWLSMAGMRVIQCGISPDSTKNILDETVQQNDEIYPIKVADLFENRWQKNEKW